MRLTPSLFFQIQLILAQLSYDQGQVSNIDNITGPTTITDTITFSNTFLKIPQIIIQPYDLRSNDGSISFKITSVTLTNFQYTIDITNNKKVVRYYFMWFATNEDRIQVINSPKETTVTDGTIYTFSHTLQQATQAAIMLHGFGYGNVNGDVDFELSVFSISSTNVKIKLKTATTIIISISYQIILGTNAAFYATNVQKTGSGAGLLGSYSVKRLQNSILFHPFIGVSRSALYYLKIIISSTTTSSNYEYTYSSYGGSLITSVTCQSVQFFTQILFPYYTKKYFVTKQFVEFPTQQILVKFIELNQSFNSDTLTTFNLPQTQSQLNIQIEIALSSGKKVQGYFLKCNDCGDNNKYIINQAYYYQGSFIKFRIQLLQYVNVASNLIFSITSNKILIQQVINQAVDIYDIILLEIINE